MKKGFQSTMNPEKLPANLMVGQLVYFKKEKVLKFLDQSGRYNDLSKVNFLSTYWNDTEGLKELPKPYIIDAEGKEEQIGDSLLYQYTDNRFTSIIVLGSLLNLKFAHTEDLLNTDIADIDSIKVTERIKKNEDRYYSITEDGKGDLLFYFEALKAGKGNFVFKFNGADTEGITKFETNKKLVINQCDKDDNVIAQIFMDNTEGSERIKIIDKFNNTIEMKKDGTVIETPKIKVGDDSETLKKIFDDLFTAIQQMVLTTNTGSTIAPPVNWAQFETVKNRIDKFMEIS